MSAQRTVVLLHHPARPAALEAAVRVRDGLAKHDIATVSLPNAPDLTVDPEVLQRAELIVVLGGDGTILTGTELAHPADRPVLGVNLGHVGFLAEAEQDGIPEVVARIVDRSYAIEERLTLDIVVERPDGTVEKGWALNEATIDKAGGSRVMDAGIAVDGLGLTTFGCDGVIMATPTGSTAYAFSAGGPIVWPTVEALLLTPIAAHALFSRPLVVAPTSVLEVTINAVASPAIVWCDGRRSITAPAGTRVRATRGKRPVLLARLNEAPFSGRLVAKFNLPVEGFRGAGTPPPALTPETISLHNPATAGQEPVSRIEVEGHGTETDRHGS